MSGLELASGHGSGRSDVLLLGIVGLGTNGTRNFANLRGVV